LEFAIDRTVIRGHHAVRVRGSNTCDDTSFTIVVTPFE